MITVTSEKYFIISSVLLILAFYNYYYYTRKVYNISKIGIYLFFIAFYGLNILRAHDTIKYYMPFFIGETWRKFEPLYTLINFIGRKLGIAPQLFIFIICAASIIVLLTYLEKMLPDKKLFFLLVYLLFNTLSFNFIYIGLLRQGFALCILCAGIYFYTQDKKYISAGIILAASLIHYFSIIFFAIFLLDKIKKKYFFIVLIVGSLLVSNQMVFKFISTTLLYVFQEGNFVNTITRLAKYSRFNELHSNYIFKFLAAVLSYIIILWISDRHSELDYDSEQDRLDKDVVILGTILFASAFLYFSHETSIRILYNFNLLSIVAWLRIYHAWTFEKKKYILYAVCAVSIVYSIFSHAWIVNFINRTIV